MNTYIAFIYMFLRICYAYVGAAQISNTKDIEWTSNPEFDSAGQLSDKVYPEFVIAGLIRDAKIDQIFFPTWSKLVSLSLVRVAVSPNYLTSIYMESRCK